jgi:hypothetical protein
MNIKGRISGNVILELSLKNLYKLIKTMEKRTLQENITANALRFERIWCV